MGRRFGVGLWQVGSLVGFRFARSGVMSKGVLGLDSWNFFKCSVLGVSGELLLSANFLLGC